MFEAESSLIETIIQSFNLYYGLDWLAFASGLAGMYLPTRKNRYGFLLSILCCISGFAVAMMSTQYGFIAYNLVLMSLMAKGYREWGQEVVNS